MEFSAIRAALIVIMALAAFGTALAGPCDAHFSFDGNLADSGGNGYDGMMLGDENQPVEPQFVAGKFGQALSLDGTAAMRSIIDLHIEICPQVTISAWVRVESAASEGGYLVSSANGYGPALRLVGNDGIQLVGMSNGLIRRNVLFSGAWQFVTIVYDNVNKLYRLHWGAGRKSEKAYTGDPRPPNSALWVGAYTEGLSNNVVGITIDELHIAGRVLDDTEIAQLRSSPPGADSGAVAQAPAGPASDVSGCTSNGDCPTGSYCAVDGACYSNSQLPVGSGADSGGTSAGFAGGFASIDTSSLDLSGVSRPDLGATLGEPDTGSFIPVAPGDTGIAGRWEKYVEPDLGPLGMGNGSLALIVDFYGPDTNLSGHMWFAATTGFGPVNGDEPLTNVSRSGDTVRFSSASLGDFVGQLSADGSRISSELEGPDGPIELQRTAAGTEFAGDGGGSTSDSGQVMAGTWQFTETSEGSGFFGLDGSSNITLAFTGPDSVLSGTLYMMVNFFGNPVQGEESLKNIIKNGRTISFATDSLGDVTGELSEDLTQLTITSDDPAAPGSVVFTKQ